MINELRIGNYIRNTYTKEIFYVTEILKDNFISFSNNRTSHTKGISLFEPIPLTEEILLKCGFYKGLENNYHFSSCRVWHEKFNNLWFFFYDKSFRLELSGFHDLQNAYYYTHDKTELEINGL